MTSIEESVFGRCSSSFQLIYIQASAISFQMIANRSVCQRLLIHKHTAYALGALM